MSEDVVVQRLTALGIDSGVVLQMLKTLGIQFLQMLLQVLTQPAPAPKMRGEKCDHAACCCEVNLHLAKAIQEGCCHSDESCDHEACCKSVVDEVSQALVLAVEHQRHCCC